MIRFIFILSHIILPIMLQGAIGFVVQKKMQLNLVGITKIQLYLFIPILIFTKIAKSTFSFGYIFHIFLYTVVLFLLLAAIATGIAKVMGLSRKKEKALVNAITLRNQGNYAIPLIALAFIGPNQEAALAIHMVVLFSTNILLNTFGLYNTSSGTYAPKEALKQIMRMPIIYAIFAGFIVKALPITFYEPLNVTFEMMGDAVVPLALFTMGAQLAGTKIHFRDPSILLATIGRLIISPALAYVLVLLFGFEGIAAQVLILGAAAPSAVNSVLLAIEFDGDSEYASQAVFLTTLLSVFTVTFLIAWII